MNRRKALLTFVSSARFLLIFSPLAGFLLLGGTLVYYHFDYEDNDKAYLTWNSSILPGATVKCKVFDEIGEPAKDVLVSIHTASGAVGGKTDGSGHISAATGQYITGISVNNVLVMDRGVRSHAHIFPTDLEITIRMKQKIPPLQ